MAGSNLASYARDKLVEFIPLIDQRGRDFFGHQMQGGFGFNARQKQVVAQILGHSREYLLRSQKKIRPAFVYYGYRLGGQEPDERIWQAALGVDLVHAALLMHDDFMDRDTLRRGGPTTHKYFEQQLGGDAHLGEAMAVNVGDALLCLGFELVQGAGNPAATAQLLRGITNTAYGQAYDVSLEALGDWTEEDVLVLHRAKTSIYTYENPLFIGAHLAGLSPAALEILRDYATDGGVAFQLQDDLLGVFGTPDKTGKSADSDLLQGKCTLLVLRVLKAGTSAQKRAVERVWGKQKAARKDLDAAKQAVIDSGSYAYSRRLAQELAHKAACAAFRLRELKLNLPAIDFIQGVAQYMVEREV